MTFGEIREALGRFELKDFPFEASFRLEGGDRMARLTVLLGDAPHEPANFVPGDFTDTAVLFSLVRLELQNALLRELDGCLFYQGERLVEPGIGGDSLGFTRSIMDDPARS